MTAETDGDLWIGFDLGGTKMNAVLFDKDFQPLASKRKKTRGAEGEQAGLDRLLGVIDKLLEESGTPASRLAGIGIGVPGPLDLDSGIVLESPNLGWKNLKLRDALEKHLGCRAVVANDVDVGVFGEYSFGAGRGARTVLGVFPGTGIGGGMVYEGKIFRGKKSSCLEIGHIPVVPEGAQCGCGRRGCLETVASRLAISSEAAKAAFRGQAPHLLKVAGTDLANIRSGALATAIRDGDKIIERIVRDGVRHLGRAIGGAINMLAPDIVLLGGGLVEAMPKLYVEEVEEALEKVVMPSYLKSYRVVAAELGDEAGVRGAAAWAKQELASLTAG